MTFVLIHADRQATLLRDDPIVPASQVPAFNEARDLLDAVTTLRGDAADAAARAAEAARAEGYAAGHAEGLAAGAASIRDELMRLVQADAVRVEAQRADLARLALEVVRRIAADLGAPETVAALADRAAAAVAPDPAPVVRVHPDALSATRARLDPRIAVEADASLAPTDCVVATPLGEVRAGLETQLAALARAWGLSA